MEMGGQRHALAALTPEKRAGTHCIGSSVGPRAGRDNVADGTRTYSNSLVSPTVNIPQKLLTDGLHGIAVGLYQTQPGQRSSHCAYAAG